MSGRYASYWNAFLLYHCDNDNASSHKCFFSFGFRLYLFVTVLIAVLNFSDYSEVTVVQII